MTSIVELQDTVAQLGDTIDEIRQSNRFGVEVLWPLLLEQSHTFGSLLDASHGLDDLSLDEVVRYTRTNEQYRQELNRLRIVSRCQGYFRRIHGNFVLVPIGDTPTHGQLLGLADELLHSLIELEADYKQLQQEHNLLKIENFWLRAGIKPFDWDDDSMPWGSSEN